MAKFFKDQISQSTKGQSFPNFNEHIEDILSKKIYRV